MVCVADAKPDPELSNTLWGTCLQQQKWNLRICMTKWHFYAWLGFFKAGKELRLWRKFSCLIAERRNEALILFQGHKKAVGLDGKEAWQGLWCIFCLEKEKNSSSLDHWEERPWRSSHGLGHGKAVVVFVMKTSHQINIQLETLQFRVSVKP